jgi:hypothetical protein
MQTALIEPEIVVVKAFGGQALVRWLVGLTQSVAEITDDAGAQAVRDGRRPIASVGFRRSDVFVADPVTRIRDGDYPNWDTMSHRF